MNSFRRNKQMVSVLKGMLYDLPSPKNISYWWKFGSLLGLFLVVQLASGIFLSMHYVSDVKMAFSSVDSMVRKVDFGWLIRKMHAKGASAFFLFLYLHIGRGAYYGSYIFHNTWKSGVTIFMLAMATAFLGYVLPWGQMSYWGATVITKFFSTVPYMGSSLVEWMWGGFAVSYPTLTRFFSLHFLLPLVMTALMGIHLVFLHSTGSKNPLGLHSDGDKMPFFPYFAIKDLFGFSMVLMFFLTVVLFLPDSLGDPENYMEANSLVTPVHMQPEWYFLPAYAILRAIPNKLGGVIALALSMFVLYIFPLANKQKRGNLYSLLYQASFWSWISVMLVLLWMGSRPVEEPMVTMGMFGTALYFIIMSGLMFSF